MNLLQFSGIIMGCIAIGIFVYIGVLGYRLMILQDKIRDKLTTSTGRKE